MIEVNQQDLQEVSGGLIPLIIGTAVGSYAAKKAINWYKSRESEEAPNSYEDVPEGIL